MSSKHFLNLLLSAGNTAEEIRMQKNDYEDFHQPVELN
jgi:hypothetical protein